MSDKGEDAPLTAEHHQSTVLLKTLKEIFAEHSGKVSDKWSAYLTEYERIFEEFRDKPVNILEIGVQNGGSLEIWSKFFPNARNVLGCDLHPDCARLSFDDPRIAVVVGDANSDLAEQAILRRTRTFDIIIDDGSHRSSDIVKSFARYFPHLSYGGVFIAEDLHCSYWQEFEGGLYYPYASLAFFKRLADIINHEHWRIAKRREDALSGFFSKYGFNISEGTLETVNSVQFLNSACVIRKEAPQRNKLNARVIAGTAEMVQPGTLQMLHSIPGADQTSNQWTARNVPPDEELPLCVSELANRDTALRLEEARAAHRDAEIAKLNRVIAERDGEIASLNGAAAEHHRRFETLWREAVERDQGTETLNRAITERGRRIETLSQAIAERDKRIAGLDQTVAALYRSTSWRITAPLRFVRRAPAKARPDLSRAMRALYHHAPLPFGLKMRAKAALFGAAAPLFRNTVAYKDWKKWQLELPGTSDKGETSKPQPSSPQLSEYVPPFEGEPPRNPPAKLIAFYLPQFHPIPENDKFWGKGFTEWTNVSRAVPQFEGHYQPRLPGELGFYDLRVPDVQKRQIALAKQYGIHAFCFHFYWFAGKRLLEMPLEQFVSNTENDFPFCINWANENWTRRWDGRENEVLFAQKHSDQDDLAFIEHVAKYLCDPRYLRINGKPLLLVYRPGLLPSARKTADRWREWCRANGVGEIYLAYTQSFDSVDPADYHFDAAIEFPPNLGRYRVTNQVKTLREDFECSTFDWTKHLERSRQYAKPSYVLFRGLCPSWDNTARRKNKGSILLNSSPHGYREWLSNAIADTLKRFTDPAERLIFINGWNEWAEGAYLEPDARYGYAYLEATRLALADAGPQPALTQLASATVGFANAANPSLPRVRDDLLNAGFPTASITPRVSIIIAAYNQLDYTLRCLDAVRRNTRGDFEVILVDDFSSDQTPTTLPQIGNLRYFRNERNVGFLNTSNIGASYARGECLLFLNNDTEVRAGWLDPMLELMTRDDNVAVVGSKLLNSDGSLQEAGGIYWQDARGTNYGRGDCDPEQPRYNYVREVDKCSGACLMVRKSLFDSIGGFDATFAPAYKEDADLCFKVRQLGYKVMYQPRSVVVHHEGISCGKDVATGIKRFQDINRPKFISKWGETLQTQHLPNDASHIVMARERPHGQKVVLVVDYAMPEPDNHAGGLGMFHYVQVFLSLGYKVVFLPDDRVRSEPYTSDLQQLGVEAYYGDFDFDAVLSQFAPRLEIAWLSRPEVAFKYLGKIRAGSKAKILYCGRDLHFLRTRRRAEIEERQDLIEESARLEVLEKELFRQADAVLTFSTNERDLITEMVARANVEIVSPYVFDRREGRSIASREARPRVLFVGNFYHIPNVDAVRWFFENCWSTIRNNIPDAELVIVGSGPPEEIRSLQSENTIVEGHVKDLSKYFDSAVASVAPLRYGAGVKGKIVTSMHYGCPVVTTGIGAEGMGLTHGVEVLIGNDPHEFSQLVIDLCRDHQLRDRLVCNAAAYVKKRYSRESVASTMIAILSKLGVQVPAQ